MYWAETHTGRGFQRWISEPGVLVQASPGDRSVCLATLINGGITVVSPAGETSHIETGDLLTTNICFGDTDGSGHYRDAYITASGTGRLLHMRWPNNGLRLNYQ